jgi:hypothetical protein
MKTMWTEALTGLVFVAVGEIALLLMAFTRREVSGALAHAAGRPGSPDALRRSAWFWEAAARSAWLLSALGAIVGFATILCEPSGDLRHISSSFAYRTLATACGVALAAIQSLPALRLAQQAGRASGEASAAAPERSDDQPWRRVEHWLGYVLFVALIAWPLSSPGSDLRFRPSEWLLHGPAWLLVAGGALAIALYLGDLAQGGSVTVGLSCAGLIGILFGLAESLHGFTIRSMEHIAGGLMLMTASCFAALVGMATIGLPLQDRAFLSGRRPGGLPASRFAAYAFPLLALFVLVLTGALVMIPFEKPAG